MREGRERGKGRAERRGGEGGGKAGILYPLALLIDILSHKLHRLRAKREMGREEEGERKRGRGGKAGYYTL